MDEVRHKLAKTSEEKLKTMYYEALDFDKTYVLPEDAVLRKFTEDFFYMEETIVVSHLRHVKYELLKFLLERADKRGVLWDK